MSRVISDCVVLCCLMCGVLGGFSMFVVVVVMLIVKFELVDIVCDIFICVVDDVYCEFGC